MSENISDTQPNIKIKKPGGGRRFLFNALGVISILAVAIFGGFQSGLGTRRSYQSSVMTQQLGEQFQFALVDIQFGRYENAKQRLEWIIQNDPSFPGAQQELTNVLVRMNQPTPTATPSLTPTPDFTGAEQAYTRAQQLIAAQDWPGAIGALDEMRKLDPNYNTSLVDGMYYFALRNYGVNLINSGNLEGGIYQITLAERFGTLDRDANGLREGARVYLIGASFWELDWSQAVSYFQQASSWGNLWDGTMTSSARYHFALMRLGDELLAKGDYCGAYTQYTAAQGISALDSEAQKGLNQATQVCYPATATFAPATVTETPTPGGPPTDTPSVPTDTPVPPTDTPPTP
jgi:tetratricopeptide (TPR) repeat protein